MNITDFDYILPQKLIAKEPAAAREQSRLLVVNNILNAANANIDHSLSDLHFADIVQFIKPNDLIIFNDSKVMKARLFGNKISGGRIEVLVERIVNNFQFIAHVRSNKTINPGMIICLPNNLQVTVTAKLDGLFQLETSKPLNLYNYLEQFGHIPLPPYINKIADKNDVLRYQTVYAKDFGSVAAPTAGLHFTSDLLTQIKARGAKIAYVTLHVGSGTFKPVSVTNIAEHKMHSEVYSVSSETLAAIEQTRHNDGSIIAVGTTSLRTLETIARNGFTTNSGETDIFITPGFKFKLVDKLITNFHLPKSTLLMLVAAFCDLTTIKKVYTHAIANHYRFFSYGDAMLLTCMNKMKDINGR